MRDINFFTKIFVAVQPVDFRKQANGLFLMVESIFKILPNSSKMLFVFTNRHKNAVKMVYWDATGVAMWSKRLEKDPGYGFLFF